MSCLFERPAACAKSARACWSHSKNAAARSGCFRHLSAKFSVGSLGLATTEAAVGRGVLDEAFHTVQDREQRIR